MCGRVFDLMGVQTDAHQYKFTLPSDKLPRAAILFPEHAHRIKGGPEYPDTEARVGERYLWYTCRCCYHKPLDEDRNPDSRSDMPDLFKKLTINQQRLLSLGHIKCHLDTSPHYKLAV